jgi:CRISPR-associated protein Cas5a/b/c
VVITRFLYALIKLHWGFTLRIKGATAAQPSLPVPSPTTVLGAFAYPMLKILGIRPEITEVRSGTLIKSGVITPMFNCFIEATVAASAGLDPATVTGLASHSEVSRIIAFPYKMGGQRVRALKLPIETQITLMAPIQAVGSTYGPGSLLHIGAVIDLGKLAECLNVSEAYIDSIGLKSCYGISRIGSKEGIVSVIKVAYGEPKIEHGEFHTIAYVPENAVEVLDKELFMRVQLWDLNYKLSTYYIPVRYMLSSNLLAPPIKEPLSTLRARSPFKVFYLSEVPEFKVVGS